MQTNVPFDKRLKRIVRRHDKMSNGVVRSVNSDGLIVARPRMYKPKFPLKGLLIVLTLGFLFKGFLLSYLGTEGYAERLADLEAGTVVEQAGAWVMQSDPVTAIVASGFEAVLPK